MKREFKKRKYCRCCKSQNLLMYLDLGNQPLANSYHHGEILPEFPLEVVVCKNCYHSQLSVVVEPNLLFKNYLYVSGTTQTFKNHCRELALEAVKRVNANASVLDIACNDGTQLQFFRDLGCSVWGVDPANNLRKITKSKKIPVVVGYWSHDLAKKLNKKFDIITGTNVFAHIDDLDEFLKGITVALKDDGILILEFPYAEKMIINNEFDTVYHEHLSYFTVNSFVALMKRVNFNIVDVLQTPIHGGSIRFFIKKGKFKNNPQIRSLLENEKKKELLKIQTYKKFQERVNDNKAKLIKLLEKIKLKNQKVIGYGASAKGNTMLNYFKVNLDYIVDDNSLKWGYLTPGRNILIKNPLVLAKEDAILFVVILSWNFYNEIVGKISKLRKKTNFILYVPDVKIIVSD